MVLKINVSKVIEDSNCDIIRLIYPRFRMYTEKPKFKICPKIRCNLGKTCHIENLSQGNTELEINYMISYYTQKKIFY